jgi:hypothetical protein
LIPATADVPFERVAQLLKRASRATLPNAIKQLHTGDVGAAVLETFALSAQAQAVDVVESAQASAIEVRVRGNGAYVIVGATRGIDDDILVEHATSGEADSGTAD